MQSRVVEGEKPHLLVVDDDPDMGEFIADVAEMVGYCCTLVADTAHFQTALGPDVALILLDLIMPGTDGVELLRVLGQHGYAGRIVLMSGCDTQVLDTADDLAKALGLHVPTTELKIDRPFVQDAVTDTRARIIVQKTIELGHELGMRVVAEGVETPGHLDLLKAYACDVARGYLFSRPLAGPDLVAWLRQRERISYT